MHEPVTYLSSSPPPPKRREIADSSPDLISSPPKSFPPLGHTQSTPAAIPLQENYSSSPCLPPQSPWEGGQTLNLWLEIGKLQEIVATMSKEIATMRREITALKEQVEELKEIVGVILSR